MRGIRQEANAKYAKLQEAYQSWLGAAPASSAPRDVNMGGVGTGNEHQGIAPDLKRPGNGGSDQPAKKTKKPCEEEEEFYDFLLTEVKAACEQAGDEEPDEDEVPLAGASRGKRMADNISIKLKTLIQNKR